MGSSRLASAPTATGAASSGTGRRSERSTRSNATSVVGSRLARSRRWPDNWLNGVSSALRRTLLRPVGGTKVRWSLDRPKHHASTNDWQAGELG